VERVHIIKLVGCIMKFTFLY